MAHLEKFPPTHRTYLTQLLAEGALEAARNHVMSRAYEPLCDYARASSLRVIDDATDLVSGFFASRLSRNDYLERWLDERPAVPLRRWLVNGLLFYARERVAEHRRARRAPQLADPPRDIEPAPWRALERAWRDGLLQSACDRVSALYSDEGRADAWRLFLRHVVDGVPYPALESELNIARASAPMITRTALRRLRAEIDAMLGDECASESDRARELEAILFGETDAHD